MHKMFDIQDLYQEYAFINPSGAAERPEEIPEEFTGAATQWDIHQSAMYTVIGRTYDNPKKWYFVVAKPFNDAYAKHFAWYEHKGLDAIKKKIGKADVIIGTKEIKAAKVHVNFLVCCDSLPFEDGCNTRKYKLAVYELAHIGDRERVLAYILKESEDRTFVQYSDYVLYIRG